MSSFFSEQGRTRVYAEAYFSYVAGAKAAENAAQGEKSHLWMETNKLSEADSSYEKDGGL